MRFTTKIRRRFPGAVLQPHRKTKARFAAALTAVALLGGALVSGASSAAQAAPAAPGSTAPAAQAGGYDRYTLAECRQKDKDDVYPSPPQWYYLNRFSSCGISHRTYVFKVNGKVVALYNYRVTVLGSGFRDRKQMQYELYTDKWNPGGQDPSQVDSSASIEFNMECLGSLGGCARTGGLDYSRIEEWINDSSKKVLAVFDTTGAPPERDDTDHYLQDRVSHSQLAVSVRGDWSYAPRDITQRFRCDEPYNGYGGTMKPGCIYDQVPTRLHYSYKTLPSLALHIYTAQKHPERTYPTSGFPNLHLVIPGDEDGSPRKPLRRLYPGMDEYAQTYYDNNRSQVSTSCAALPPQPQYECDEYPFASTWEGAYFHTLHNDPSDPDFKWNYSVRYIPGPENGAGGSALASWYVQDHVLAGDPFWVKIDDIPEELK